MKKNVKNKKKVSKKILGDIKLHSDFNYFYLENSDYFLTFSDKTDSGISIVENIIVFPGDFTKSKDFDSSFKLFKKENKIKNNYNNYNSYNSYILQKNRFLSGNTNYNNQIEYFIESSNNINIINFANNNLNLVKVTDNLKVANVKSGYNEAKIDLSQIIYINQNLNIDELISLYKLAIETKIKYFEYLKLPEHIKDALNNDEFLILSCKSPKGFETGKSQDILKLIASNDINRKENISKEIKELENELIKTIIKSCNNSLKNMNLSFGILDYIISEGITIDSLVDAGMELFVGVEQSNELKFRLKSQILKSLEDLNVVALLMSAIRTEEDFQSNRLREVDVSDDPAYLYTDEVLGIAIANQIAGTKAIFNFKRYDEEKPGIIAELGPMVDDIFAGLIAGCMSKIFEDDY